MSRELQTYVHLHMDAKVDMATEVCGFSLDVETLLDFRGAEIQEEKTLFWASERNGLLVGVQKQQPQKK